MRKNSEKLKFGFLILGLALYLTLIFASFSSADPTGGDATFVSSSNYSVAPTSRTDSGGTITTITLDAVQQIPDWKAYVGNITGSLVLRNADGWSIYEWATNNSVLSGFVFVSRSNAVDWDDVVCANGTHINAEQSALGISNSDVYSINKTFNYSTHSAMDMSGSSNIAASSCFVTATYVNGSAQTVDASASFQELVLYDLTDSNFVYATFIDQDNWGYNNNETVGGTNATYDFQLIVAENRSLSAGTEYWFYADLS